MRIAYRMHAAEIQSVGKFAVSQWDFRFTKTQQDFFLHEFWLMSKTACHASICNSSIETEQKKKQNYNTFFVQYVVIFCMTSVKYMLVLFHQNDAGDNLISIENVFIKKTA